MGGEWRYVSERARRLWYRYDISVFGVLITTRITHVRSRKKGPCRNVTCQPVTYNRERRPIVLTSEFLILNKNTTSLSLPPPSLSLFLSLFLFISRCHPRFVLRLAKDRLTFNARIILASCALYVAAMNRIKIRHEFQTI